MVALIYDPTEVEEGKLASLNVRNIPLRLRRQFKMWCAERGLKMENVVVLLIEKLISDQINKDVVREIILSSDSN